MWSSTPMAEGRKRYRVALLLTTDLARCRPDSLKRLMAFPKAMCKIIRMTRTTTGKLNGMIRYVDMTRFLDCARTGGMSREEAIMNVVHPFTVMTADVEAWRLEDLKPRCSQSKTHNPSNFQASNHVPYPDWADDSSSRAKEPIKPLEFKPIIKDNQVVPASTLKGYVEACRS